MSGREIMKISDRFELKQKLGQGTFSKYSFSASPRRGDCMGFDQASVRIAETYIIAGPDRILFYLSRLILLNF